MRKLRERLNLSDQRTGFRATSLPEEAWVMAEVTPGSVAGFWHVAVIEREGIAKYTKRPVHLDFVDYQLEHFGITDADFQAVPSEPRRYNPWDPEGMVSETRDVRDVYFVQGVDGGLIKIGVARDPEGRLASIRLMSPVRLRILGVLQGAGEPEERRLHERFAEHRSHGEWFRPAPELIDYIQENA